jgi:hypothetical protein
MGADEVATLDALTARQDNGDTGVAANAMEVRFLDAGQGDCSLIRLRKGAGSRTVLRRGLPGD